MDHSKKLTYLFSIDALRVIAILAVILIHSTTKTLQVANHDVANVPFSLLLNQMARFAVPLFFLISGFVLELNNKKNSSYVDFFRKRASRVVVPFIFWSSFYYLLGNNLNFSRLISVKFISTLINGSASYHLYFIPTLIIFYLVFPLLHLSISFFKKPVVLAVMALLQVILLSTDYYKDQLVLPYDLRIAALSIFMFILGMVASHNKDFIYSFVHKHFLYFLFFLITLPVVIFIHVSDLTLRLKTSGFIYNQYSPLNYMYTIILSGSLFYLLDKVQYVKKAFMNLSKLSFFVFFIHVLIQTVLWDNLVSELIQVNGKEILTNLWFDPLMFFLIAVVSFLIAFAVQKIPYISKITG